MAKSISRQGISKRIHRALEFIGRDDPEDAIFNISPAVDATAAERYPDKKVGERIKQYIFDEQQLIYYFSMQGKYLLPDGVRVVLVDDQNVDQPIGGRGGELSDFIYYCIRNPQTHEAEIDYVFIDFGRNFGIGRERFEGDGGDLPPGKFIISKATIIALILSVICAPENRRIKLEGDISLFGRVKLSRANLVGNKAYLMEKLQELFQK